ncbi:MAG: MBL fold metallo-hydrolase [Ignavibacteriales bacterium CG_4_9_14_3_um_filter_34_10]|nr:MAG: MBL fold metallo-hydrolase [Ignavibacteriales bacterium CG_4_9_14_3_um_filter_34_10]
MQIGKYQLEEINAGSLSLDGGAMFGVVPKTLWQRSNPADELNRVALKTRSLLVRSESKIILVDTGIGNNWDEKFCRIYGVEEQNLELISSLKENGIAREDVTDVLLTHLHFDHTGGSVIFSNGKYEPAFPNAKYHVQKRHFELAINPTEKDKASFIKDRFNPLIENNMLKFIDGEAEFDDNISFVVSNGHTNSMQLVKVSDGTKTLLYSADLFPFASHIPLPYIMAYDINPLITLSDKKRILSKAIEEEWILFFEHDPEIVAATVSQNLHGYGIDKVFEVLPE